MDLLALICEDSPSCIAVIKLILEKSGYKVDVALTAQKAKEMIAKNKYDLLTLDFWLPDMRADIFLKDMMKKEEVKDLPVIIISSEDRENCNFTFDDKVVAWIDKKHDIDDLSNVVHQLNKRNKVF